MSPVSNIKSSTSSPATTNERAVRPRLEATLTAASFRPRRASAIKIQSKIEATQCTPQHSLPTSKSRTNVFHEPSRTVKRKRSLQQSADKELTPEEFHPKRRAILANDKSQRSRSTSVISAANVSEAVVQTVMEIAQPSRLMSLPPELRNMIWRFTVVSPKPLTILGDTPKQPSICRASQQTRKETLQIFYRENSFACTILNYDPTDFKNYRKTADQHGLSTVLLTHRHEPTADRALLRKNLLIWLEGTFKGETAPLGYSSGHSEDTFVWEKLSHRIVKVFNQAKLLRNNVSWDIAKQILANAVDAAGVCGEKRR